MEVMCETAGLSQRRACRLEDLSLSTCRYSAQRQAADTQLSLRITELALASGRRIKCLTYVSDFTKECLTIATAFRITGVQVTRILDSIALSQSYPATIRTDQGPEFTCRALDQWAFEHGVELRLIQPDKPTQNGFEGYT